jgi:hypothetical protein
MGVMGNIEQMVNMSDDAARLQHRCSNYNGAIALSWFAAINDRDRGSLPNVAQIG